MKPSFQCPCCHQGDCDPRVKNVVSILLEIPGTHFSSGFRCPKHNEKAGGSSTSSHLDGFAADIEVTRSRPRFLVLQKLLELGIHRIGIYEKSIHFDIDSRKDPMVVWRG